MITITCNKKKVKLQIWMDIYFCHHLSRTSVLQGLFFFPKSVNALRYNLQETIYKIQKKQSQNTVITEITFILLAVQTLWLCRCKDVMIVWWSCLCQTHDSKWILCFWRNENIEWAILCNRWLFNKKYHLKSTLHTETTTKISIF